MKNFIFRILPIIIILGMGYLVVSLFVPFHEENYELVLKGIKLKTTYAGNGGLFSLEPQGEVIIKVNMTRCRYLLRPKSEVSGSFRIWLDKGNEPLEFVTRSGADSAKEGFATEKKTGIFSDLYEDLHLYCETDEENEVYGYASYSAGFDKILWRCSNDNHLYFCSEEETELEKLLEYFEGQYRVSTMLHREMDRS